MVTKKTCKCTKKYMLVYHIYSSGIKAGNKQITSKLHSILVGTKYQREKSIKFVLKSGMWF